MRRSLGVTVLVFAALAIPACRRDEPPAAPPAARDSVPPRLGTVGGIQARDTEVPGLVADLLTASREEGRLTVAVRFRNAGTDTIGYAIPAEGGIYPGVRLTAGGRDWPIARDEEGDVLAPKSFDRRLAPGQSMLWRAVFEAPPRNITTFDLAMPRLRVPFRNVSITDRATEPTRAEEIEEGDMPQEP